jgi:O-antigen biosynthesis protein
MLRTAGKLPGVKRVAKLAVSMPNRRLVAGSGLFDREYFEAQRGVSYPTEAASLANFLVAARSVPYSPHPLFESLWFDPHHKRGSLDAFVRFVKSGPSKYGVGPLFDPAVYLAANPGADQHPGGVLGHFTAHAGPDTPLPVPPTYRGEPPLWGPARQRLLELARRKADLNRLARSPLTTSWNHAGEAAFVSAMTASPVETGDAPLVSVVMPVRDRAGQVGGAIASVQAQTFTGWQLLVVDDGSTDGTGDVVAALAAKDPRIILISRPAAGLGAARNAALEAATGSYVAFLDADFRWMPHYLQVMTSFLRSGSHRAVRCVVELAGEEGERSYLGDGGGTVDLDQLMVRNQVNLNGLLAETGLVEQVGGFDQTLRRWLDHDLAIRLARVGPIGTAPTLGARGAAADDSVTQLSQTESDHWEWVVLAKYQVDWQQQREAASRRVPGRISISMPTFHDYRMTIRAVNSVLATCGEHDVEIVVVDNGSNRSVGAVLVAAYLNEPRVRIVSLARNLNFAIGSNVGMAVSTGSTVIFLNNDTEALPGWLDPLLAELQQPQTRGAQPLLLFPNGTIQSAGSLLPGGDVPPMVFLAGHPPQDALRAAPIRLRIVTAAALAVRAEEFAELDGFDPIFVNGQEDVDYCLRAVERHGGRFAVATDSVVIHHERMTPGRGKRIQPNRQLLVQRWRGKLDGADLGLFRQAGFELAHLDPGPPSSVDPDQIRIPKAVLVRPARMVTEGPAAGLPSLRWAIKLAAHPGPRGDGWGDVHFGAALTRALERLGQEVVIDRRETYYRDSSTLDDVVLTIRGLEKVPVQPGRVNLLWVISHPDLVTRRELETYDTVFAASTTWAERMTAAGTRVLPLLQATEQDRFNPDLPRPAEHHDVLFVGRSRNVLRPIVRDAVEAGVDLSIYGDLWEQFGLAKYVKAQYLPYQQVGSYYADADIVLNDHWTDMAAEGFVSNRLFDAVACGARVVSDQVAGLDELFSGMVQVYRSVDDLRRLCGPEGREIFPDDETRRTIAKRVAAEHSFDARARQLLDAAISVRQSMSW